MSRLLLALALLAAAATAEAVTPPPVVREVLRNGLTVLVRPDASVGVAAVSLQVRAGSLFEAPQTAGITNFLHRVMIRGTKRHGALALTEAVDDLGGTLDASGDVEYGEVRGTVLARNWEPLLKLIAEVALEPTLPPEEVERERRLIQSALQTRGDTPFQLAFDSVLHDLYGAHPYAWPSLGRRESIERIPRAALQADWAAIYRPDRMVLAVSGDVPSAAVVKAARRLFGDMPAAAAAARPSPAEVTPRGERRLVERPVQQAQVLVGYLGPSLTAPDYAAVRVLGTVLGGGMSGRLFRELRDRRGLAYSVGVLGSFRTGPSFLVTYLGTAPPNVEAAEAGVLAELERVREEAISESELARAKAYLLGALAMDRRTSARHAWYLAFFEVIGAGWDFPDRYARAVEAVTTADVNRAAQRYLARPTVVVLQPPKGTAR
ncbi:MAG TPA: pitrilysin family protein [Methylomirabilota bacterium]|nr:pitrilysin family protein [Methylomirabilota bacterium]